jgi:hypothetical protein
MPTASDLQRLIAPDVVTQEKNPREVLYETVFLKLMREHCVAQSFLDSMIELYCRWSKVIGKKACVKDAEQAIDLAVKDFMKAVPLKSRKTPKL